MVIEKSNMKEHAMQCLGDTIKKITNMELQMKTIEPVAYVRRDQLQKAKHSAFLCAMYPNTDGRTDLQPLYDATAMDAAVAAERERHGPFDKGD